MARPKKNNADYFSHESEMRNDVKIKALRRKFSHTGYAVWNYLLEVLTDAEGFAIRWEELDIELYAADFDLDATELTEIVDECIRLDLLNLKDGKLTCRNLRARKKRHPSSRLRKSLRKDVVKYILKRDNYTCTYCGRKTGEMQIDHIIPVSKGGLNDISNLTTACAHCNRKKSDKPVHIFLKILSNE